jgi:GAF domain-containing protein
VLSVPVRLADQPVGTLNVYATQPRAWTPAEVQALGAFAVVTAELGGWCLLALALIRL